MNTHALAVLQFHEALTVVSQRATSSLGKAAVCALTPATNQTEIETELRRVDEMAALLVRTDPWGMPGIPDIRGPLRKLAVEGSALDGSELRDLAQLLSASKETRNVVFRTKNASPLLEEIADALVTLEKIEKEIDHAIDEAGTVRDHASKDLSRIRRELRGARSRIVEQLESYMGGLPSRFQVSDASVTVRDGRYVVPVRREARSEIGGIVRDESATGATLFVEPPVAIELMNRLRELEIAEAREVQRILREITNTVRPHEAELRATLEALVALDSLYARARYASEHGGIKPQIVEDFYNVVNGFHPLLLAQQREAVPFDLLMEPDERTLLVSGPNTGGKTVLLKAVGLISLLTQSGVIPPVGPGTKLPVFTDFFADIGDEQSIEASLSTFSAHLKNLREILEHADRKSLVLIDEMGSGTDPAEGGALAHSILSALTQRNTLTVATTHLGQLKLLAGREKGVVNASLQFDAVELRPTYRLQKGVPGRSYGLAIARRLGFPHDVLNNAEAELPKEELEMGRLLTELEEKENALAHALDETERTKRELEKLQAEVIEREQVIKRREKDAERRARQQARDLLLNAREEVEAAIRDLRATGEEGAREARRRIEEMAKTQLEKMPSDRDAEEASRRDGEIEEGGTVEVVSSGAIGQVLEIRDGKAQVEIGGLRLQVPLNNLKPAKAQKKKATAQVSAWTEADFDASHEVNLLGMRVEEAQTQLQAALDGAIRAALPSLRIIHGKGTGALRQMAAQTLKADPRVRTFRAGGPGEGGLGVTVAELR